MQRTILPILGFALFAASASTVRADEIYARALEGSGLRHGLAVECGFGVKGVCFA